MFRYCVFFKFSSSRVTNGNFFPLVLIMLFCAMIDDGLKKEKLKLGPVFYSAADGINRM